MAALIGLGVGVDYALFIVTRFRAELRGDSGYDAPTAVVTAMRTAGRAVLTAGTTVVIGMLGLLVLRQALLNGVAIAAATVAMTVIASLTLLPALLSFTGTRLARPSPVNTFLGGFVPRASTGKSPPLSRACMVRGSGRSRDQGGATMAGEPDGSEDTVRGMFGPDVTFLGVPRAELSDLAGLDIVFLGAPYDSGTSHRPGARFGPQAIRMTDYLPHDASRPHLALGVDPLAELRCADIGDVMMPPVDTMQSLQRLENAVLAVASAGAIPVILGGDHTVTLPDATGVARHVGWGRLSLIHFDAHADTGDTQFGSLVGHGTPMRRLIESGAVRGDRFLQIGLRGYWPEPPTLAWMAEQQMRSFEMSEIVSRGIDDCLTEAFAIAVDECDGVFLSVDVDVVDPGMAPGTGTPEPGGLTARQLLDAVRRIAMSVPLAGIDVVEVSPPYDHAEVTAFLGNRVVLEALSGIAWRRRQRPACRSGGRTRRCSRAGRPREPKGAAPTGLTSEERARREGGASRAPGGEREDTDLAGYTGNRLGVGLWANRSARSIVGACWT